MKLAGYQDDWKVRYGDAPFSLAVETNNIHYNLPEYTVIDAKDANGNDIDKADIATRLLSVSREGEVTIKGAGSATIKLLYPTAINYTEAKPLTVKGFLESTKHLQRFSVPQGRLGQHRPGSASAKGLRWSNL